MNADAVRWPLYYVPPGMQRPAHILHKGGIGVGPNIGPVDATPQERGGTIFGAGWDDRTLPFWKKTTEGWWLALGPALPMHLLRLSPMGGSLVRGAKPEHAWLVPRLLRWQDDVGLVSAVPTEFRDYAWQPPAHLEPLMIKLRCMFFWTPEGEVPAVPDTEAIDLAIAMLQQNYHISIHEMTADGWMTDVLAIMMLRNGAGMDDR